MAEVVQVVCDVCNATDGVAKFRVSTPTTGLNRAVALDLCEKHGAPIMELEGYGRQVDVRSTTTRPIPHMATKRKPAPRSRKIYTPEELDRLEEEEAAGA